MKTRGPRDRRVSNLFLSFVQFTIIKIPCFSDTPEFGITKTLLDHFPNVHIGVPGISLPLPRRLPSYSQPKI